jgi:hypothetical protein
MPSGGLQSLQAIEVNVAATVQTPAVDGIARKNTAPDVTERALGGVVGKKAIERLGQGK